MALRGVWNDSVWNVLLHGDARRTEHGNCGHGESHGIALYTTELHRRM